MKIRLRNKLDVDLLADYLVVCIEKEIVEKLSTDILFTGRKSRTIIIYN